MPDVYLFSELWKCPAYNLQGEWKVKKVHKNALQVFSLIFCINLMLPPLIWELLHINLLEFASHNQILVLGLKLLIKVL